MIIRSVVPHELEEAQALSDCVFRQPEQQSMGAIFPALFQPGISQSYAAFTEEGRMVAFMGMVPEVIRVGSACLNVFGLGSVCTHPDYRGQNIASSLLEACMQHAKRAGASLVFVSGDRTLYMRAGCQYFGRIRYASLTPSIAASLQNGIPDNDWTVRSMRPEDIFAVHGLLASSQAGYEQSPAQLLSLLGAAAIADIYRLDSRSLVAIKNGKIQAFAVGAVHGGERSTASADEPARAVEWAGDDHGCLLLFAEMLNRYPAKEMILPVPWQQERLLKRLQQAGATITDGLNSGTVWMADAVSLLSQCTPLLPPILDSYLKLQADGTFLITDGRNEKRIDDHGLLSLLFDPDSPLLPMAPKSFRTLALPYMSGLHFV